MDGHDHTLLQRFITIRTPENLELRYPLAGAGTRSAAYLIDLLIMVFVGQMLVNLIAFLLSALVDREWGRAVAGLLGFSLYTFYFIVFEWLLNGQTPGKRIVQVRVIKDGGYSLRFTDTLLRNLLRVVDFLPLFYGVGLVSLLFTSRSQRLGDLAAGTLVVHNEAVETESALAAVPQPKEQALAALPAAQVTAVPAEVVTVSVDFFQVREELAPRYRQQIAGELVHLVRRSSGLAPLATQSAEGFLAALIHRSPHTASSTSPSPAGD